MATIDYYEGRPIFKANNSHQLAEAVAKFNGNVEAPYVVMVSSKKVKDKAFWGDKTVGVALFEEGKVTAIGEMAFADCPALTTVVIPKSVEEIWQVAFAGCSALEKITVSPENSKYDSREDCNAIIFTKENYLLVGCKTTIIPDTITCIGDYSFSWIKTLTKINIPASVKEIRGAAFKCSALTEIDLPESVVLIRDEAFANCEGMTSVVLPRSVKEIGTEAFMGTSITSINIPKGVKKIYSQAFGLNLTGEIVVPNTVECLHCTFAGCNKLNKVIINSGPDVDMYGAFEDCTFVTSVGPIGSGASVELRTRVKNIDEAFENCTNLTDIVLPEEKEITIEDMPIFKANNSKELADAVNAFDGEVNPPYIVQVSAEKIEGGAFSYNNEVGGVILEDTVKEIGAHAFCCCEAMKTINIPKHVTSIGFGAFSLCYGLEKATFVDLQQLLNINFEGENPLAYAHHLFFEGSKEEVTDIIIPDGTKQIGDYTFNGCNLVSVTIPQSVKSIGACAFSGCSALTSIMLPDSIKTIGMNAFAHCGLTSVTIPNSVKKIDEGVFWDCGKLESVELPDSIKSIGLMAFQDCESLTSIIIPDSVTKIGSDAFLRCIKLTSVTIGDGVKTIPTEAFRECKSLKSVFIGDSVEKIGKKAFEKCTEIRVIQSLAPYAPDLTDSTFEFNDLKKAVLYVPKDSIGYYRNAYNWWCFDNLADADDDKVYKVAPDTPHVIIPDGITKIGDNAFCGCTHVTSVEMPDSVIEIGKYAFSNCPGLKNVTIGNSVTSIGQRAFEDCTSLANIIIPESVTVIEDSAFYGCGALESIDIPDSVTKIAPNAFCRCCKLTSVKIPDGVTEIGTGAFRFCVGLTSISIPDSVTKIGGSAFVSCSSLTSIKIPDSVKTIGEWAFEHCSSLTSIEIPDSVKTIGEEAFRSCSSLTSIEIPDSVMTIGDSAFESCSSLTSIEIPDSVKTIGEEAFRSCSSLTSIKIPDSVKTIGEDAFKGCSNLKEIYIKDISVLNDTCVNPGVKIITQDE